MRFLTSYCVHQHQTQAHITGPAALGVAGSLKMANGNWLKAAAAT